MQSFLNEVSKLLHENLVTFHIKLWGAGPVAEPDRSTACLIRLTQITRNDMSMQSAVCVPEDLIIDERRPGYFQQRIADDRHIVEECKAPVERQYIQISYDRIGQ